MYFVCVQTCRIPTQNWGKRETVKTYSSAAKGYLTLSTIFHPTQHLKHFFFSISDLMPLVVFIDIHVLKQVISATIFKQPFSVFVEIFYWTFLPVIFKAFSLFSFQGISAVNVNKILPFLINLFYVIPVEHYLCFLWVRRTNTTHVHQRWLASLVYIRILSKKTKKHVDI